VNSTTRRVWTPPPNEDEQAVQIRPMAQLEPAQLQAARPRADDQDSIQQG